MSDLHPDRGERVPWRPSQPPDHQGWPPAEDGLFTRQPAAVEPPDDGPTSPATYFYRESQPTKRLAGPDLSGPPSQAALGEPEDPDRTADASPPDPGTEAEAAPDTTTRAAQGLGRTGTFGAAVVGEPAAKQRDTVEAAGPEPGLSDFEPYRDQLRDVAAQLAAGVEPSEIPGHLGGGKHCQVYDVGDGNVLKIPRQNIKDAEGNVIERRLMPFEVVRHEIVDPLMIGRGRPGIEQITTNTEADGGGIVCKNGGIRVLDLPRDQIDQIPPEHFDDLMRAFQGMEGDLCPDFVASNIVYDQDAGRFTVIDYDLMPADATMRAATMALSFGFSKISIVTPFDPTYPERPLPKAAENFHDAYRRAFGDRAANYLLSIWSWDGFVIPGRLESMKGQ